MKLRRHQVEALEALEKSSRNGVIWMTMRSGKTLVALEYCKRIKAKKILWIAYDTDERDRHLEEECKKHNYVRLYKKMDVTLINSLHKYEDNQYDIVIYNECHTITEKVHESLSKIKANRIIGLTGTYPNNEDKKYLLGSIGLNNILYRLNEEKAIDNNSIADYEITIIKTPLDTAQNIEVNTRNGNTFYTSELKEYNYLTAKIDQETNPKRKKMLALTRMRKLNTCPTKVRLAKELLKRRENRRTLVFAQNSKHSKRISDFTYNSKTTDKAFNLFQDEKIPHLVLINKASTGTTYKNLDGCILLAVNSSNTSILQKIGRTLLARPGYTAEIIIIVCKDTVEEKWINKSLKDLNPSKITYKNIKI